MTEAVTSITDYRRRTGKVEVINSNVIIIKLKIRQKAVRWKIIQVKLNGVLLV